ncbi:hypothetical protein CO181_03350, partial [candidate division WWE3 bacterium CG_4_9_14_3_um_filter_43_9]
AAIFKSPGCKIQKPTPSSSPPNPCLAYQAGTGKDDKVYQDFPLRILITLFSRENIRTLVLG